MGDFHYARAAQDHLLPPQSGDNSKRVSDTTHHEHNATPGHPSDEVIDAAMTAYKKLEWARRQRADSEALLESSLNLRGGNKEAISGWCLRKTEEEKYAGQEPYRAIGNLLRVFRAESFKDTVLGEPYTPNGYFNNTKDIPETWDARLSAQPLQQLPPLRADKRRKQPDDDNENNGEVSAQASKKPQKIITAAERARSKATATARQKGGRGENLQARQKRRADEHKVLPWHDTRF